VREDREGEEEQRRNWMGKEAEIGAGAGGNWWKQEKVRKEQGRRGGTKKELDG
jgi:hypothetical protein